MVNFPQRFSFNGITQFVKSVSIKVKGKGVDMYSM